MDQKTAFDAGYRAYEDGSRANDTGAAWNTEPQLAAVWRAGWYRGREDSVMMRRDLDLAGVIPTNPQPPHQRRQPTSGPN